MRQAQNFRESYQNPENASMCRELHSYQNRNVFSVRHGSSGAQFSLYKMGIMVWKASKTSPRKTKISTES